MPKTTEWTLLVFMAGDNDLDAAGVADLLEMKKAGSTKNINVVVQFDRAGQGKTQRLFIQKGAKSDVVETIRETNSGDGKVLQRFVRWGIENYPARRYLLVLWNHGMGWDDTDVYRLASIRTVRDAIAFDDTSSDFIDNTEMKEALSWLRAALGRPVDVLGFDACLMNMLEVVYQLRSSAAVIVGSQEVEPNSGWPYDAIVRALDAKPAMTNEEVGEMIVRKFVAAHKADMVTQSSLRVGDAERVRGELDLLCRVLLDSWDVAEEAVISARGAVQSFTIADYVDLGDFCKLLATQKPSSEIVTAANRLRATVNEMVIARKHRGTALRFATGLSIHFPLQKTSKLYATLDFARHSLWPQLLHRFHSGSLEL